MEKQFASENFPPEIQKIADRMNISESAVGNVRFPPLPMPPGITGTEFQSRIRPDLVRLFEKHMYGPIPPRCAETLFRVKSEGPAFGGIALRREIELVFRRNGLERKAHMLLYLPAGAKRKVPVFFGLNFVGNHAASDDPEVSFVEYTPLPFRPGIRNADSRASREQRGIQAGRWGFERAVRRGFASATICYHEFFPDRDDGFEGGIMPLFYSREQWASPERETGSISAWAWGIERAIDCLESMPEIDRTRIIVHGHSRLGKTALWAGANDPRIALTVSNCSGTCGAKLAHRNFGENYGWINFWNPHWMRASFSGWSGRDSEFPIDQHMLMAAIAPRLLYVASADGDTYADPRGEFASAEAASHAWEISGGTGLGAAKFPSPGVLVGNEIGYYLRHGEHNFTPENWEVLLGFAERRLC